MGIRLARRAAVSAGDTETLRVAAIQPNIPQLKKWPSGYASNIFARVEEQTELVQLGTEKPDLIVWPETAVPGDPLRDPDTSAFVRKQATRGVPILVGGLEFLSYNGEDAYFNSSLLFAPDGTCVAQYRKMHLVPFGEYIPFDRTFSVVRKLAPLGFSCIPGQTMTVFQLPIGLVDGRGEGSTNVVAFSALICFEDTVASLARRAVKKGARMLVNQTNDGWFDGSSAAVQHMSHCVFRCIENRVPAVRSANTGVTCFIDRTGRVKYIVEDALMGFKGFKTSAVVVPGQDMPLTFYTRFGDWPFAFPCGLGAAIVCCFVVTRERRARRRATGEDVSSGEMELNDVG
jgi:apolipoprotein N-acyltransferase